VHPYIEVAYSAGKLVLNTATTNYSFGSIQHVYEKAFREIHIRDHNIHNVLILGFGSGTAAELLNRLFSDRRILITGVEKDERIIYYAKTYFNADKYSGLTLVHADAYDYILSDTSTYDLVIVDVAIDLNVPPQFEDEEFLKLIHSRIKKGGILLFNKVTASRTLYKQYLALQQKAVSVFQNAASMVALGIYRMLICYK
jgi:spermidine synthase